MSTDPKSSFSAKFLGSRSVQFEFSDGRVEEATLSQDGAQIDFINGVTWTQVHDENNSSSEHLNLPKEEDGLIRARISVCSIRSNTFDNDVGELVDIPADIDFRPNFEIKQNELQPNPVGLKVKEGGEELFKHSLCE